MDFNELLIQLGETISRRRRLFLVFFIVCFLAAIVGAYLKPQKFESQATIYVTLASPRLDTSQSEEKNNLAIIQPSEFVASQVELMQTKSLIEELVDTVPPWIFERTPSSKWYIRMIVDVADFFLRGLDTVLVKMKLIEPENKRYERIKLIEDNLEIFPVRKSQVIEVSFTSKNPAVPKVVLEAFIDIYRTRLAKLRSTSEGATVYLQQAEKLSTELAKAEQALADFMAEKNVFDIEAEKAQILTRLDSLAPLINSLKAASKNTGRLEFTVTSFAAPPQILEKITTLNGLLIERIRLAASYTENQRDVLRLDKQISSLREALRGDFERLSEVIEQDRARLEYLQKIQPRYDWLSRQTRVLAASYETYSKAAKDRETFFDRDNQILTQVIDAPTVPYHPLKPSRLFLVITGFFLSLMLAMAAALITEWIFRVRSLYATSNNKITEQSGPSEKPASPALQDAGTASDEGPKTATFRPTSKWPVHPNSSVGD
ncbi:GumC family protein [Sneathiella aquimaris]|uniref:GumC family protein n=1 Tax=Sneathiella aquimaris TaxID=2599305 RepID=UPI00146D0273|nr:Wzz/FepE/Etk N-terminal domain-containing protein [Sneathiella aquimaris]